MCLLEHELMRHQLKIVGLAEVRWTKKGKKDILLQVMATL